MDHAPIAGCLPRTLLALYAFMVGGPTLLIWLAYALGALAVLWLAGAVLCVLFRERLAGDV